MRSLASAPILLLVRPLARLQAWLSRQRGRGDAETGRIG